MFISSGDIFTEDMPKYCFISATDLSYWVGISVLPLFNIKGDQIYDGV